MQSIREFKDEYRFLSNFYPSPFTHMGIRYLTVEHFYQAMKSLDHRDHIAVASTQTPGQAKKAGQLVTLRPDWDYMRLLVMCTGIQIKFEDPTLQQRLLNTKDALLFEGNTWNDRFWGIDIRTGEGQN